VWLRYQSLWDLNPDVLYSRLGLKLKTWMSTLEEIKYVLCSRILKKKKENNINNE